MPYTDIDFMSERDAENLVGRDDTIVISIRSSYAEPAEISKGFKDVLYLAFDSDYRQRAGEVRFSEAHADQVLDFVERYESSTTRIVVNCGAGECRSAAVAHYLSSKYKVELQRSTDYALMFVCYILGTQDRLRFTVPTVTVDNKSQAA